MSYETRNYAAPDGRICRLLCRRGDQALHEEFFNFFQTSWAPASAPGVVLHRDVIVAGGQRDACLYHPDGRRIDAGMLPLMFPRLASNETPAPEQIDPATFANCRTVETPVVFQSPYFRHWGHFLLEACGRLWAGQTDSELARLPSFFPWPTKMDLPDGPQRAYLTAAGVNWMPRGWGPTRLAECYLPDTTYASRAYTHALHLKAPHRVARSLLNGAPRLRGAAYLSRSRLKAAEVSWPRMIDNEMELEEALAARGVLVVHMQELTLAQQIEVMNSHSAFIAPLGSALHNTLFSLNGREISTYVLIDGDRVNYMLIDNIVGNAAHYLATLVFQGNVDNAEHRRADIDATLGYLHDCGVF